MSAEKSSFALMLRLEFFCGWKLSLNLSSNNSWILRCKTSPVQQRLNLGLRWRYCDWSHPKFEANGIGQMQSWDDLKSWRGKEPCQARNYEAMGHSVGIVYFLSSFTLRHWKEPFFFEEKQRWGPDEKSISSSWGRKVPFWHYTCFHFGKDSEAPDHVSFNVPCLKFFYFALATWVIETVQIASDRPVRYLRLQTWRQWCLACCCDVVGLPRCKVSWVHSQNP